MRLLIIALIALLLAISTVTASSDPVLLFSDMTSAPKTGWDGSATQGAAVTIWGNNLGDSRGDSYVTVNGVDLTQNSDYAVWGEYWPTQYQQRITFWLNSGMADGPGQITVTVNGVASNPLDFTIRNGRIFIFDNDVGGGSGTSADPYGYFSTSRQSNDGMARWGNLLQGFGAGDLFYFRAGTYQTELWVSEPSSDPNGPVAWLAYPGEKPFVDAMQERWGFSVGSNSVVAGFRFLSRYAAVVAAGDNIRVVGNDGVGIQGRSGQGTGIFLSGKVSHGLGSNNRILGNAAHGGWGGYRLDHAIYLQGCASEGGAVVGWNHIYDNDFGRGPLISINHMDDTRLTIHDLNGTRVPHYNRCKDHTNNRTLWPPEYDVPVTQIMDSHFVLNNRVECYPQRATAVNVWQLSYKSGEDEPEPTYVYNNIFDGCGTYDGSTGDIGFAISSEHNNGHAHFYNNVWYNTGFAGINFQGGLNRLGSIVKNNIIHMNPNVQSSQTDTYYRFITRNGIDYSNIIIEDNIVYGLGPTANCTQCGSFERNHNVDPLFVDPDNGDFRLQNNSPAIGAGQEITFAVQPPLWANIGWDHNHVGRGNSYDIGAMQFGSGSAPIPPPRVNNTPSVNASPVIDHYHPNRLTRMNRSHLRFFWINASDADGDVLNYSWLLNGTAIGSIKSYDFNGSLHNNGYWNVTVVVTDGNSSVSHSWSYKLRTPKKQDITDDDVVDVRDLRIIAKHVIKKKSFRQQYDQNNDGIINIFDLISVIREFGTY